MNLLNLEQTVQYLVDTVQSGIKIDKVLDSINDLSTQTLPSNIGKFYLINPNKELYLIQSNDADGAVAKSLGVFPKTGPQGIPGQTGPAPTITIARNGNWIINGVDTGRKSFGGKGATGPSGPTGRTGSSVETITSISTLPYEPSVEPDDSNEYDEYSTIADLTYYDGYDAKTLPVEFYFKIKRVNVVNDLVTGGIDVPLSAEQGKVLNQEIQTIIATPVEGVSAQEIINARQGQPTLGVNLTSIKTQINTLDAEKADKSYIDTVTQSIASGSPKGTYATLTALETAFPIGTTGIYVVAADGNWYYWNSSTWTAGGTYQGTEIANNSVTPIHVYKSDYLTPTLVNVFNKETVTSGYYMDATGTEVSAYTWGHSDFIPVVAGQEYEIFSRDTTDGTLFTLEGTIYDSAKTVIGSLQSKQLPHTWTAPVNASYIIINYGLTHVDEVYFKETQILPTKYNVNWLNIKTSNLDDEINQHFDDKVSEAISNIATTNKWNGKTANFLGDSITYGATLSNIETERYSTLVGNALDMTINNHGANGTRIANHVISKGTTDSSAMSIRYTIMSNSADIVFVMGGTNDYASTTANGLYTAPFGVFSDRDSTTFYGALHTLYSGLINKYLGKQIVVIVPIHRAGGIGVDERVPHPDTNKNFLEYCNAIREVAEFYGIITLDLQRELCMNPVIPAIKTAYFADGVHPNAAGHQQIANAIINFMKRL